MSSGLGKLLVMCIHMACNEFVQNRKDRETEGIILCISIRALSLSACIKPALAVIPCITNSVPPHRHRRGSGSDPEPGLGAVHGEAQVRHT